MQLKMQWLGEVAKIKAEQGGEGLIRLVLPLISSGCDGWLQSPTGPSITESTSTVQSASITVSFPHKADLWWSQEPLAIGFSMINTKTRPGIIRESKLGRIAWHLLYAFRRNKRRFSKQPWLLILRATQPSRQTTSLFDSHCQYAGEGIQQTPLPLYQNPYPSHTTTDSTSSLSKPLP